MRTFRLLILTAIFSFFAVYTVIWSVLEPFPIPDCFQMLRWRIIAGISLLVVLIGLITRGFMSYILYRYIRPYFIHKLQLLGTRHSEDSLAKGWKKFNTSNEANPDIVDDSLFGKACRFDDMHTHDSYHGISVIAKEKGRKIDYFIKPNTDDPPVIYIRIEVRNISNSSAEKNEPKWLAFVIDKVHKAESYPLSENEEIIYVHSKATFMGWMFFSEDVENRVNKISQWQNIYVFNKIEGIKVRGNFDMGSILIYA